MSILFKSMRCQFSFRNTNKMPKTRKTIFVCNSRADGHNLSRRLKRRCYLAEQHAFGQVRQPRMQTVFQKDLQ